MIRIDGIVCLGFLTVDYDRRPRLSRAWLTAIADGVETHEDRAGLRPRALCGIEWDVVAYDADMTHELEACALAVRAEGNAAAPLLGLGRTLDGSVSGSALIMGGTLPVAGDWFLFGTPAGKFARKVLSVVGTTVTFTEAFPYTLTAGTMIWPLIFGRATCTGTKQLAGVMDAATWSVVEPMGVGERATQSCPAPSCPTAPTSLSMCEPAPVVSIDTEGACGSFTLSWASEPGATWKVWKGTSSTGPWTLVDTVAEVGYSAVLPLRAGAYYSVTVIRGSNESDRSNVVFAAGVRLEKLMRIIQERRLAVNETAVDWPDRTLPTAGDPGEYPTDGFYDADIAADPSGATEAGLVQSIYDVFGLWLQNYLAEPLEGSETITRHDFGVGIYTSLPYLVDSGALDTAWRDLVAMLCAASRVCVEGEVRRIPEEEPWLERQWRIGQSDDESLSPTEALAELTVDYAAAEYHYQSPFHPLQMYSYAYKHQISTDPDPVVYHYLAKFVTTRNRLGVDLTNFPGTYRLHLRTVPQADGPAYAAYAPTDVDSKYHYLRSVTGAADYLSPDVLGNYTGGLPVFASSFVDDAVFIAGSTVGWFVMGVAAERNTWTHKL